MNETVVADTRQAFSLDSAGEGVATLSFDLPGEKVNKLTSGALRELDSTLEEIAGDSSIRAVVLVSGKDGSDTFIAGADIQEILEIHKPEEATAKARQAQAIFDRLAALPQPVVAAVHGACLGGGTELVLACDLRIASDHPRTSIGLPEVRLGLMPGFGGTQRLPRLIGIQAALGLILTGKPVDARKAARLGVVDRVAPPALLTEQAVALAREAIEEGGKRYRPSRRRRRGLVQWLLESTAPGRKLIWRFAEKNLRKQVGPHYPAPYRALEAVLDGYPRQLEAALELEAEIVGHLIASSTCKNLISVFLDSEKLRRAPPAEAADGSETAGETEPVARWERPVRRAAILGAGVMGGGIAALLARKGFHVRLRDIRPEAITSGLRKARESFDQLVRRRRISPSDRANCLAAIGGTTDLSGFRHVEFVIEAVVEDMGIKKKVLEEVEPLLPEGAIFATNTSALSIDELAGAASRPGRVAGMHFFNPVHRMPLVEIVYGETTAGNTLERLEALTRELGKYPLRVRNGPGFLVNRLLMPYLNEAAFLFMEGFRMQAIDRHAEAFGLPMGPFALLDEVGLDVAGKVADYLEARLGIRARPCELLTKLVEKEKALGKKTGAGFYVYRGRRKRHKPNVNVFRYGGKGTRPDEPDEWIRRMLYPMVNEAAMCLEDGIVQEPWEVDIAMILGTGFPPFLGGPLHWADSVGLGGIVETLERFERDHAGRGGERFRPAPRLRELAASGRGFHRDGDAQRDG